MYLPLDREYIILQNTRSLSPWFLSIREQRNITAIWLSEFLNSCLITTSFCGLVNFFNKVFLCCLFVCFLIITLLFSFIKERSQKLLLIVKSASCKAARASFKILFQSFTLLRINFFLVSSPALFMNNL